MKSVTAKCKIAFSILIFLLLAVRSSFVFAQEEEEKKIKWLEFKGYVKDLQQINMVEKPDSIFSSTLLHNRLNFRFIFSPAFSASVEMRNRIFLGDQLTFIPDFGKSLDRNDEFVKLSYLWLDKNRIVGHTAFDRAFLQYSSRKLDVKLGKQRINWGMATIWNPNDIFNAYNFLDFDYEERPGREAVRVQYYKNENTSFEAAYKPGKDKDQHIGAMLYKFNKWKYDVQLLGGIMQKDYVAGLGWAGNIKQAGFKGEMSYFHPIKNAADTSGAFAATVGADYTTNNQWYLSTSFLINISEQPQSFLLTMPANTELSPKNLMPFRYNFYAGATKSFSTLVNSGFSVIYSPAYNTLILFPSLTVNASENLDLDFIIQSFFAEFPKDYKMQATSVYFRLKWSFGY
ncbi:MAG: hypothetical protein ACXWDO_09105 [Bacteroidia bacterium]